jgi:hypothetical protein
LNHFIGHELKVVNLAKPTTLLRLSAQLLQARHYAN